MQWCTENDNNQVDVYVDKKQKQFALKSFFVPLLGCVSVHQRNISAGPRGPPPLGGRDWNQNYMEHLENIEQRTFRKQQKENHSQLWVRISLTSNALSSNSWILPYNVLFICSWISMMTSRWEWDLEMSPFTNVVLFKHDDWIDNLSQSISQETELPGSQTF